MVVVDMLSKETHFIPIKTTYKATNIADIFLKQFFRLHGIPKVIISDRDPKSLVQVINFSTEKCGNIHRKAWILPRLSVFFFRGNNSVAIEMTPNLRRKSDNVLYLVR